MFLSVQKEILRGCVDELKDVVRVVAACFGEIQSFQHPVLLQMVRMRIIVKLLQHFADLSGCGAAKSLL
jgi:hypothetical protein